MFLINLYKKNTRKKRLSVFKKNITLLGNSYEFGPYCYAKLLFGSKKDDIIIEDNVQFAPGCNIISSHQGKVLIKKYSRLQNTTIICVDNIEIGKYTAIGNNVTISDNNNHPINPDFRKFMRTTPHGSDARSLIHSDHAPIKIGENCWIGQNVRIQKGVTIGDNSIIAANSVVTKSVPANCIAAGNPAKVVKTDIHLIPAPTTCNEYNEYLKNGNRI